MFCQRLGGGEVAYVAHAGRGLTTRRTDIGGDGLHLGGGTDHGTRRGRVTRGPDVGDNHRAALVSQPARNSLAQAGASARAGDDCGLSGETSGHFLRFQPIFFMIRNWTSAMPWNSAAMACITGVATSAPNWPMSRTSMISI